MWTYSRSLSPLSAFFLLFGLFNQWFPNFEKLYGIKTNFQRLSTGEYTIGIGFLHDGITQILDNGSYLFLVIDNGKQPQAAIDFGLDPNNVMDYDFDDATQNIGTYIEEVMNALATSGANTGADRFKTECGLKLRKVPEDEIKRRVMRILDLVELPGMEGRMTNQLSGGQQQRVALALSDNIIIMNKGVVAQIGTPQEIYYHPNSEFVADFIGEANFLKGTLEKMDGGHAVLKVEGNLTRVPAKEGMTPGTEYTVVLRPESAVLKDEGGLPCQVELSCFMGSYQNYHVKVGNTQVKLTDYNPKNKRVYQVGKRCSRVFDPESVHIL